MSKREYDIGQQTEEPQNGDVILWVKGTESATDVINGVVPTIQKSYDSAAGNIDSEKGLYCANNTRYGAALKYVMTGTEYPNKLLNASEILMELTIYPTSIGGSGSNQYTSVGMGTFTTTSITGKPQHNLFYANTENSALSDRLGRMSAYNQFITFYVKFNFSNGLFTSCDYWSSDYDTIDSFNLSDTPLSSDFNSELWVFHKIWSGPGAFKGYLKELKITVWND